MSGWRQVRLLLWKDFLIRRRKLITLFGVIWAALVVGSLWIVRINIDNHYTPTCQYNARALPSAGMITFLQSFICTLNNECSSLDQYEEIPSFNKSKFTELRKQFVPLLYNQSVVEVAATVPHALKLVATLAKVVDEPTFIEINKNGLKVKDFFVNPDKVALILSKKLPIDMSSILNVLDAELSFQSILKGGVNKFDLDAFSDIIKVQNADDLMRLKDSLRSKTTSELKSIMFELLPEINFRKYIKMVGNMVWQLNGDDRLLVLADAVPAVLRLARLENFVPTELTSLFGRQADFNYYNVTIINKVMSLFEPIFGGTEAFKSLYEVTEALVSGLQWLHSFIAKSSSNTAVEDTASLLMSKFVGDQSGQTLDVDEKAEGGVQGITSSGHAEVFDLLSKVTNFIVKWLPKQNQHDVLLYATLISKLMEGAKKVIVDNVRMEEMVYNASLRNPGAIDILTKLPPEVIGNVFDALTDAKRIEILSSQVSKPGRMFCDVGKLQSFLQVSKVVADDIKSRLCSDVWSSYVADLIHSFGIMEVRNNINNVASLLIQETLGKDISGQLYSISRNFQVLKSFTQDLIQLTTERRKTIDWSSLLNGTANSELLEVIRSKQHLGKQVLITVHGAFAHEVVKQNTILEIKITPILLDTTTILEALNKQLRSVSGDLISDVKTKYGDILKTMLLTLLEEDKTLGALSRSPVEVFCGGSESASKYVTFPPAADREPLASTMCEMSVTVNNALVANSSLGKAIKTVRTRTVDIMMSDINWPQLISNMKDLYKALEEDFPYLLNFTGYGVKEDDKRNVTILIKDVKTFWLSKNNISRTVHLSFKLAFQLLDLIDRDIFNITNDAWMKIKRVMDSTNSLVVITDQMVKFFSVLNKDGPDLKSDLPPSTVLAMKDILPNIPHLIVSTVNLILNDSTNVESVIELMNASPPWPCSSTSIAQTLNLVNGSWTGIRAVETLLCMTGTVRQEWLDYVEAQKVKMIGSLSDANTTLYDPHLFLKFSGNFDALVKDVDVFKHTIEGILANNSTKPSLDNPTFVSAWTYATQMLNDESNESLLRSMLSKVDKILNAINISVSVEVVPLNSLWESYVNCSKGSTFDADCNIISRATWTNMLKFCSVVLKEVSNDLLTYFSEINEPSANIIQFLGFTKGTGLYILYKKISDFAGVLLNSYWDLGFMNQIRRASKSAFWDCEAVVDSLIIPPGSEVTPADVSKVKPYVCPSLLHWISLPREENSLLNVVAKPQYYFYNVQASTLTSDYNNAFANIKSFHKVIKESSNKTLNMTQLNSTKIQFNTIENKFAKIIDNVMNWNLTDKVASYRLFNEVNKKQFISTIYLTRITTIVNKLYNEINKLKPSDLIVEGLNSNDTKKIESDLSVIQRLFKRRPSEAIALHFDILTDMLWKNDDDVDLVIALNSMCDDFQSNITKHILNEGRRVKNQFCSKQYDMIYATAGIKDEDLRKAKADLNNLVNLLRQNNSDIDVYNFFNERKELLNSLKTSIKYADDLSLPIYLKYLQSNLKHYNIILSFLAGEDWWTSLKDLYNGPNAQMFFDILEHSLEITENIITHLDKIHLVRLIRDINTNSTDMLCLDNITLSDYIYDSGDRLSNFKKQMCHVDRTELFKELPLLVFASQGFDSSLKLSKIVNYDNLDEDTKTVMSKLDLIRDGPKPPLRPSWITPDKLNSLKMAALNIFSKETITKITFGAIGNIVDGSLIFFNNSNCNLCSSLTSWFKQLNLQLIKKAEYDNLLCHLHHLTSDNIYHALSNDFHWEMAFSELISSRNYTRWELHKSMTEFLEQVKLLVLEDITAPSTKLTSCLAHNLTMNAFSNTSLFLSVVSNSLQLLRSVTPHVQEVAGIREVPFFKKLAAEISPRIHVTKRLDSVLVDAEVTNLKLVDIISDEMVMEDILSATVDLYSLKQYPTSSATRWLILPNYSWDDICVTNNCSRITGIISQGINKNLIENQFQSLQLEEFWSLKFVSDILLHLEGFFSHAARIFGVASRMDIVGALRGQLSSILDCLLQTLQEDMMNTLIYSLEGVIEELQPLLEGTVLETDLEALGHGLRAVGHFRDYFIKNGDLKVEVSMLFSNPSWIEAKLSALGFNNTNFWSIAAPRIHAGYIDLKPLLTSGRNEFHISKFICQSENMSKVIVPSNLDVVTSDDVYGAVIEQFCGVSDDRVKQILPVLLQNLNFTYVVNKVLNTVLVELYSASNLTAAEGAAVVSKYGDMMALLPTVQDKVGNLAGALAKEPLFAALKNYQSLNSLLSSSEFLASAGNMVCGKPFSSGGNRFYRTIAETPDFHTELDPEQLRVLPTDFCRDMYKDIVAMGGGKIIWSFVKPLIMGKILFTPQTPVVMKIIQKANASFSHMAQLVDILHSFAQSSSSIDQLSDHQRGVTVLRSIMNSAAFKQLVSDDVSKNSSSDVGSLFTDFKDLEDIGQLLRRASDFLRCVNLDRFHAMPSEARLTNEAVKLTRVNEFSAGNCSDLMDDKDMERELPALVMRVNILNRLVFTKVQDYDKRPVSVEYKIRMDIDSVPTTTRKRNQFWTPGAEGNFLEDMRYFRGFVQIQDMIDKAIIQTSGNVTRRSKRSTVTDDNANWAVYTQQIPYPCYLRDYFQSSLYESQALIVAFFFAFIMTVSSAVRFIVSEKETGNTMLMSIMGVRLRNHTFSWFVASMVELVVTVVVVILVLRVGGVLAHSDPILLLLILINYGFSIIMFCYLLSKLFTSASLAAVCAGLALLFSFMPYVIILSLEATLTFTQKIFTSLSMSTAFCYSMLLVGRYEAIGTGAQWGDIWQSPHGDDGISIGSTAIMVLIDAVLYLFIGCFIDKYFGLKTLKSNITNTTSSSEKAGVSIVNISKAYGKGSRRKMALDNVSIELHRGHVTTLLGQNGAGKTTLIKIITGMLKPTKGHVVVRSDSIQNDLTKVGVCPQQDVLFENLTAVEHLTLYSQLKSGLPAEYVRDDIESMLQVLSFGPLAYEETRRLSGGLRRRLCVALAFISKPQLVLLDEPSSGVDPLARRDIWSLIVKLKEDRTVFLTTHHLDEAELLSDQIIIMHKGQIHTVGSPIEIKRSLGNGYKLTVTYPHKLPRDLQGIDALLDDEDDDDEVIVMEEKVKQLLAVVREVVKNAQLVDVCGAEVELALPFFDGNGLNNNFLELCSKLEQNQKQLSWSGLSVDCSSLEQVMYNICHSQQPPHIYDHASSYDCTSKNGSSSSIRDDLSPLVSEDGCVKGSDWQQFSALIHKRWTHYSRNRWLLFQLLVLPSLFVAVSMAFSLIRPPYDNETSLRLHPDLYQGSTQFLVSPHPGADGKFADDVYNALMNKYPSPARWNTSNNPQCTCNELRQECDYRVYNHSDPTMMVLPNATILNHWLLSTQESYIERRYSGWSSNVMGDTTNLIAWYNNKGHHAMPSAVNALNAAILRAVTGNRRANITTYTHPLKISHEQLSKSTLLQHVADIGIAGLLLLAFSLVPAGAAIYLVSERTTQQKRLQLLCGVQPNIYWMAALTWDMLIIVINVAITACVLVAFNLPVFVDRDNLPAVCILLVLFGFTCNSLTHLTEKLFSDSSMANMIMFCANVFVGNSCMAILLILDIISESEMTDNARWVLHKVFLLSPQFALSDALVEVAKNTVQAQVLSRFGMNTYKSPLTSSLVLYQVLALVLVGLLLLTLNLAVENHYFTSFIRRWKKELVLKRDEEMEDLEVAAERRRVQLSPPTSGAAPLRINTIGNINAGFVNTENEKRKTSPYHMMAPESDVAQCVRVSKVYRAISGQRVAVRDLTLGIPRRQCTALLGENGAGKSSTFSMLSGELAPTAGAITLNQAVADQRHLSTGLVSYCPQNDAIDPLLTVKQTLQFYCRLRGITDSEEVIKRTLSMFELTNYSEQHNGKLSGGNKRKLCTAVAFMARTVLVLLDEPTSGMDPGSRACVSRGVRGAAAGGRGVLLSTHALDDARRLARRVALMQGGRLCALAPLQECLNRFGGGYVICARVYRGHARAVWDAVLAKAPQADLRAMHQQTLQFLIPTTTTVDGKEVRSELSDIFRLMADLQGQCDIEDYTINQSSLEQMFLNFSEKNNAVDIDCFSSQSSGTEALDQSENITSL